MKALSLLAAAATALQIGTGPRKEYDHKEGDPRSVARRSDAEDVALYAEHVAAADCNAHRSPGELVVCGAAACAGVEANGVKLVGGFSQPSGVVGYVAVDPVRREIVLAFGGGSNPAGLQMLAAAAVAGAPSEDCGFLAAGCRIYAGFAAEWRDVGGAAMAALRTAHRAHPGFRLVTTGHSLGAAVATLAAADLAAPAITFGSPRVGNAAFVDFLAAADVGHRRVAHVRDPVPHLPPAVWGYRHLGPALQPASALPLCRRHADDTGCAAPADRTSLAAHLLYFHCSGTACAPSTVLGLDCEPVQTAPAGGHGDLKQLLESLSRFDFDYSLHVDEFDELKGGVDT